jgi:DNA-binding NarL/FixJ family response regulator
LVEAAHDGNGDWDEWSERVLSAATQLFVSPLVNLGVARRGEHAFECLGSASGKLGAHGFSLRIMLPKIPGGDMDPFPRCPRLVSTVREMLGVNAPRAYLQQFLLATGAQDILGLVAIVDDLSFSIGAPDTQYITLKASERRLLAQVTLHLETGLRLRSQPGTEIAVLHPDGRLLHAESAVADTAELSSKFTRHVTHVERQRTRQGRQSPDALETWNALISGSWGLVERIDSDGKRYYVIVDTPRAPRLRALTALEAEIVEKSARGLSGKAVAYSLGVSESTVSHSLTKAAFKLGVPGRTELVALVAQLLGIGLVLSNTSELTSAEQDVLSLVRLGWTNAAIAKHRQRSERTVANQVASLMNKFQAPSRRSLASISE